MRRNLASLSLRLRSKHFWIGRSGHECIIPGLATNSIFFWFLFVKNHWFARRANQWPLVGGTLFCCVPPINSLVSDPWRAFWALVSISDPWRTFWADFKGPRLVSCVASGTAEKQGHRQVCRARRRGPRTPSTKTDAKLDCAFVKNAPLTQILDCEKSE